MSAFCQLVPVSAEGVGIDDISTAFNVHTVYTHYSLRVGEIEQFGNVFCLYPVSLKHSSHTAVKYKE